MGVGAIPIILLFLLVLVGWRVVFTTNRDLVRIKAWNELARRALPFIALTVMAMTLFPIQAYRENQGVLTAWAVGATVIIILANFFSIPMAERRANRAFRRGDYEAAAENFRKLAESNPLPRHHAFLGAALGAGGHHEEGVEASTRAVERDPQYGIAYYNRALILRQQNRRSRAKKDLNRALEADLPRRFRRAAEGTLEELKR